MSLCVAPLTRHGAQSHGSRAEVRPSLRGSERCGPEPRGWPWTCAPLPVKVLTYWGIEAILTMRAFHGDCMEWLLQHDPAVQAALIAASVAVLSAIIAAITTATNTVLSSWLDKRAHQAKRRERQTQIYRDYADPLSSASVSLYWRFREILEYGGGFYLQSSYRMTKYEEYKVRSTLYRLGALLAWVRALRREIFFANAPSVAKLASLQSAINELDSALAEGGHLELRRLESLDHLWDLNLAAIDGSQELKADLGRNIDATLKRYLHESEATVATGIDETQARRLAADVAGIIRAKTGRDVPQIVLRETQRQFLDRMAINEWWLYRDWQSAIADVLITESSKGSRRYDVIGFRGFEEICVSGDENQKRWLSRLYGLLRDVDVDGDSRRDARVDQLKTIHLAVASIIEELHAFDTKRSCIEQAVIDEIVGTKAWAESQGLRSM